MRTAMKISQLPSSQLLPCDQKIETILSWKPSLNVLGVISKCLSFHQFGLGIPGFFLRNILSRNTSARYLRTSFFITSFTWVLRLFVSDLISCGSIEIVSALRSLYLCLTSVGTWLFQWFSRQPFVFSLYHRQNVCCIYYDFGLNISLLELLNLSYTSSGTYLSFCIFLLHFDRMWSLYNILNIANGECSIICENVSYYLLYHVMYLFHSNYRT